MGSPITNVTLNGIDCGVLTDAPFAYSIDQNGPHRTITYLVPGSAAVGICNWLKGVGSYSGTSFTWPQPHRYPGNPNVSCVSVRLHEFMAAARPDEFLMGADLVAITAEYEVILWDAFGSDFQDILGGTTVPWASMQMHGGHEDHVASDINGVDGNVLRKLRVRVPLVTYQFSRTMIPAVLPYKTICASLAQKLNSGTWFGEARGTIRFDSWSMNEEDRDPSGQRVFTFTTNFSWRPIDWNKQLVEGNTTQWQFPGPIAGVADANYPYLYANFQPLLTYGIS